MQKNLLKFNIKKSFAFTLAEILITLGIIGVVAAITIPTLMKNYQALELKTKYKDTYSIINRALEHVAAENNGTLKNFPQDNTYCQSPFNYGPCVSSYIATKLCDYMGGCVTTCNPQTYGPLPAAGGCWATTYYLSNGSPAPWDLSNGNYYGFVLKNGAFGLIYIGYDPTCSTVKDGEATSCAEFFIDSNGLQGPDKMNSDIMFLRVLENRIAPFEAYTPNSKTFLVN